jgi:hypothetical protein
LLRLARTTAFGKSGVAVIYLFKQGRNKLDGSFVQFEVICAKRSIGDSGLAAVIRRFQSGLLREIAVNTSVCGQSANSPL